jgi:predicted ribosome quality control (RQC) complex YloA/Tae2 family protein
LLRKKEFTSFDVAAVVRELKAAVLDSRVENVYQLDSKTLVFKLHKPDKPAFWLVLEAGKRLHLTSYAVEKPKMPPAFCMALRKYLRSGWLTGIEQHEFERVVVFSFKTKDGRLQLVLELFGEGNIILVNDDDEILHGLTYKRMRDRNIVRGEVFRFAPPSGRNPIKVDREELRRELRNFGHVDVVRAIARFLSIGGIHAEEALLRAGVDKKKPCDALSDSDAEAILDGLRGLLSHVTSGKLEPCIVLDDERGFVDVLPFWLERYEGFGRQPYDSFNEALDEFYARAAAVERATAGVKAEELIREAERLRRIIEAQERALVEAKAKAGSDKHVGDAIYAHAGELQVLLDRFLAGKKDGKEWSAIVSEVLAEKRSGLKPSLFFESFDAKALVINVCVDGLGFGLRLRGKLFEDAGSFYERGKRSEQKLEGVKVALEDTRKKLAYVEAKIKEAEALERVKPVEAVEELVKSKIKRKEWFEKFRSFISPDGFLVVSGKDAVSNEVLVKRHAEPDDIVFHADIAGAPFVVIKTGGKEPSEQVLREAGEFAAAFSRGWREGFASADVYWVKPNQLSKGGPSGGYVPRGAFVVTGKRNWLRGVPLTVAVGAVVEENGRVGFVGGPLEAVRARARVFTRVVPGEQSGKELFRHVLKALAGKMPKEQRERVLKVSVEEIREFIPYGKGRVLDAT